ncbi:hypothetical protein BZL41_13245 [Pseudomonas sp. PIC25]|uniref:hypothetical protein n=1 Tax=Pseudomonas sp. PIC25 TaxID=1958773 RepID=UPI000BABF247|nr:hypothetical protein [Pseudomonas sp. PIC25]PAU62545.1 hypothetical protein BZL41_13245 [Pseudomonas sp. PIC25]
MNHYQQQRLRRSEALILLHCQLMRRPRTHSMWGLLGQQIRAAFLHLVGLAARNTHHGRRLGVEIQTHG